MATRKSPADLGPGALAIYTLVQQGQILLTQTAIYGRKTIEALLRAGLIAEDRQTGKYRDVAALLEPPPPRPEPMRNANFRLPVDLIHALKVAAEHAGAKDTSAFVRQALETATTRETERPPSSASGTHRKGRASERPPAPPRRAKADR